MSEQTNIVCLLNGYSSVRERSSDDVTVLPCQCAHTDREWIQMCRPHGEPCEALRVQSRTEHRSQHVQSS